MSCSFTAVPQNFVIFPRRYYDNGPGANTTSILPCWSDLDLLQFKDLVNLYVHTLAECAQHCRPLRSFPSKHDPALRISTSTRQEPRSATTLQSKRAWLLPLGQSKQKPTIPTSRVHMDNQLPEALPVHMPNLSPASVGFNWCPPSDVRTNCHQCARRCKSRGPPWQHRPALPPPALAMGCAAAFGLLKRTIKLRLGPRICHGRAR